MGKRKKRKPSTTRRGLAVKQLRFVEEYPKDWNATAAAKRAGYSEKTAYSQGQRLLKHVEVKAAIDERIRQLTMSADEVLLRLAQHARADLSDVVDDDKTLNWKRAREAGKTHLIKTLSVTDKGERVQLHDPQRALELIGRAQGLFIDKVEHSGAVRVEGARQELEEALADLGVTGEKE